MNKDRNLPDEDIVLIAEMLIAQGVDVDVSERIMLAGVDAFTAAWNAGAEYIGGAALGSDLNRERALMVMAVVFNNALARHSKRIAMMMDTKSCV